MSVDALAGRVRRHLDGHGATEQAMFGGICFMVGGNMAVCASRGGLLVRVGRDGMATALARPGARPMTMGARTMSGYVRVDDAAIGKDKDLGGWIADALAFVATLPAGRTPARRRPGQVSKPATRRRAK
jgi:TfoX/Sxy family transcriptional regulator of competence genes